MRILVYVLAVLGVCALFFCAFLLLDTVHRLRRKGVRGVDELDRRKHCRTEEITTSLTDSEVLDRLATTFSRRSPIMPHRTANEIVLFWGSAGGLAQFRGIASMRAEDMPLRLAAQVHGGIGRILIDEDFGFNLFFGPAREIFNDLYTEALDQAATLVRNALGTKAKTVLEAKAS